MQYILSLSKTEFDLIKHLVITHHEESVEYYGSKDKHYKLVDRVYQKISTVTGTKEKSKLDWSDPIWTEAPRD